MDLMEEMFIDNNPIIWKYELTNSPTIPVILPIIHHNYPMIILIKPMIFHYFFAINGTYFNDNPLMVPILGLCFGTFGLFFHILGILSSQLTNSYFSEGLAQPPTRRCFFFQQIMGRISEIEINNDKHMQQQQHQCGFGY